MSDFNPSPASGYSRSTWIIAIIVIIIIIFGVGYFSLYRSAPDVSPTSTQPSPAAGAASPTTLPTPAPSTPAAAPKQ